MKHVIIIETADNRRIDESTEYAIDITVEKLVKSAAGICVVRTRFNQKSAIDTVLEMFGMTRETL